MKTTDEFNKLISKRHPYLRFKRRAQRRLQRSTNLSRPAVALWLEVLDAAFHTSWIWGLYILYCAGRFLFPRYMPIAPQAFSLAFMATMVMFPAEALYGVKRFREQRKLLAARGRSASRRNSRHR